MFQHQKLGTFLVPCFGGLQDLVDIQEIIHVYDGTVLTVGPPECYTKLCILKVQTIYTKEITTQSNNNKQTCGRWDVQFGYSQECQVVATCDIPQGPTMIHDKKDWDRTLSYIPDYLDITCIVAP